MTVTKRRGIILAGGSDACLHPLTLGVSKQMLPILYKPMIFYPLSVLILAGMREVLIISALEDLPTFRKLLGDGSQYGIELSYAVHPSPDGLGQAFITSEEFTGDDACRLILGDNASYGHHFSENLSADVLQRSGTTVSCCHVSGPERFGAVELGKGDWALSTEERSAASKPDYAAAGSHPCDNRVGEIARNIKTSERGELEITNVNRAYMDDGSLTVEMVGRGFARLDICTHESLLEPNQFVHTIEHREGLKLAFPEEMVFNNWRISADRLGDQAEKVKQTNYGAYSAKILAEANGL